MTFDPNKKAIPIGISDFKTFVDKDYYYVDKTLFIKELLDNKAYVNLFTRPRRFGKTLNLYMIKYFFEKTEKDNSYLFKDKKIWQSGEEYRKYQGKYPVISLSFKGTKMNNWDQTYTELIKIISEEYKRHDYLLTSLNDKRDKDIYIQIKNGEAKFSNYIASIKNLCRYLNEYYGKNPIILIDEYDVPLQNSYVYGFYDEAINFIRAMLQNFLKDNQYLEFAIITGCLRISKESIFTGLNNLEIISILNKQYCEHFGFTQEEVNKILKYYNLEKNSEIIKKWYDGYQFGSKDIYNPWSLLKCVKNMLFDSKAKPEAYWVNTSGNDIVKKLVKNADPLTKSEIEQLINGGTIEKALNANITYNELDENIDNVWSMLFFTGYLTYTEERRDKGDVISYYRLKIPNRELLYVYQVIIRAWFTEKIKAKNFNALYQSIVDGKEKEIRKEINKFLLENISFYDTKESFYHGILTGILSRIDEYNIYSNLESGYGRSDIIILEPIDDTREAIVIELKVAKEIEELETKCDEALKQIEDKQYETYLKKRGFNNILKYGIAFCSKRCLVKKA